ncbi:MAG TPA: carboxypeptidase-like regulatory domain-containing protein [Cyclobacteriaceae bacterium]|nr:carboxypeptidase-like regulatory domain-containing protein [Cyclobacteriaceae bacterium]
MNKYLFIALIVPNIFIGCNEKDVPLEGKVIGFVRLLDKDGGELLDRSGVKVTMSSKYTTVTDELGKFEIKGVDVGTYIVTFEKEGFGIYKKYNFTFAGGGRPGVLYDIYLLELPVFQLTQFHVYPQDNLVVQAIGSMTEVQGYNFTYYFSAQNDVSSTSFDYSYGYSFCCGAVTEFNHLVSLAGSGFSKGQTVYMTLYASNATNKFGFYNYYDYESGKTIDPALKKITEPFPIILK